MKIFQYCLIPIFCLGSFVGPDLTAAVDKEEVGTTCTPRDYWAGPTKYQRETISWIIRTIGSKENYKIYAKGLLLKSKGKTVEDIHPLNFLLIIFTSEELKAAVKEIPKKPKLIRDGFYDGIIPSLKQEQKCKNLKPEYIVDFAKKVKIDPGLISPFFAREAWEEFVNFLIDNAPRETETGRYNM